MIKMKSLPATELQWMKRKEAHIPVDNTIVIQKTFKNDTRDHSSHDMESSKRNGQTFLREWFESFDWLVYNKELKRPFGQRAPHLVTHRKKHSKEPLFSTRFTHPRSSVHFRSCCPPLPYNSSNVPEVFPEKSKRKLRS